MAGDFTLSQLSYNRLQFDLRFKLRLEIKGIAARYTDNLASLILAI